MTKASPYIIGALLLATAIWRAPLTPVVRYNFTLAMSWAAIGLFVWYLIVHVNVWMGLFLALATVSAYYPINTLPSEKAHQMVLYGIVWYAFCVHFLNTNNLPIILNIMCIIALANVVMLIFQGIFNWDPIHTAIPPKFTSIKADPAPNVGLLSCNNGVSALLAMSFPAFCRQKWFWFIPLILLGLVLAHTFAGPMAVMIAVLFAAVLLSRRWFAVVGVLGIGLHALTAYYIFVDVPDLSWRWLTWKTALVEMYPQRPWLGSGIGHWKIVFTKSRIVQQTLNQVFAQAHNEPIQVLFEMGIGGALIIVGYLITSFWKSIKSLLIEYDHVLFLSLSALLIIFIDSLVFFPFHIGITAIFALTWMAILDVKLCQS